MANWSAGKSPSTTPVTVWIPVTVTTEDPTLTTSAKTGSGEVWLLNLRRFFTFNCPGNCGLILEIVLIPPEPENPLIVD